MAEDDYKVECHLTPNGWVDGTSWFFDKLQGKTKPRPIDAVETWIYHETQSSTFSKSKITWTKIWTNPIFDKKTISDLHNKYPQQDLQQ